MIGWTLIKFAFEKLCFEKERETAVTGGNFLLVGF